MLKNKTQDVTPPGIPINASAKAGAGYPLGSGAASIYDLDGGYYESDYDDETVDIDGAFDEYSGNTRLPSKYIKKPVPKTSYTTQKSVATPLAVSEKDRSGASTPRIKLRFSLKKTAADNTPPPLPLSSATLQSSPDNTESNATYSTHLQYHYGGAPLTAPASTRGRQSSVVYSPSLGSDDGSDESDEESHAPEHRADTPASTATPTALPTGSVRKRGRPPLRGRRSSSISSWNARGGSSTAQQRRQIGGPMTTVSLKSSLERLIKRIRKRDSYGFFLEPVDTTAIPDYLGIIKTPMDLGTIQRKVETNGYTGIDEFRQDILLVCENARKYNGDGSIYARSADRVQEYATVAIDRETTKLVRVGMASVRGSIAANDSDSAYGSPRTRSYAERSRSRSHSRSRSRSRSTSPTHYNSGMEEQSDSHMGRRSTRRRWRGTGSEAPTPTGAAPNATAASIVDIFKWSGGSKRKTKRGSMVPRKITETQLRVSIVADGSVDPTGFEDELALVPYQRGEVSVPLLAGARGTAAPTGVQAQKVVQAYGQWFHPMTLNDIGPFRNVPGTSLAAAAAGMDRADSGLGAIYGDVLGLAYWQSVSDFIGDASDEVAEYAATVLDHLTDGSYTVARETIDCITGSNSAADTKNAKVDVPAIVGWLDNSEVRDKLFTQRVDALTRAIPLQELAISGVTSRKRATPWMTNSQIDEQFAQNNKKLKTLYEQEIDEDDKDVSKKKVSDEVAKGIYDIAEQIK
ncbi:hypothetical protein GGI07_001059 [Coemansia sp. Benny D115]|nr:hypothetical protein GGI07_001059 [Coemansia sp. Benny D115]